ncbi:hypothetical protein ACB098_07G036000 [Castanea mollissima]
MMNNSNQQHIEDHKSKTNKNYLLFLVVNYVCLFLGSISSTLLSKFYFNHKGSSRWVSTWVQTGGFPLLIIPIYLPYFLKCTERKPFTHFTRKLLILSVFVGIMLGINNLLYSWGNSYLPLIFNLILSVLIVKQKVTFSNLNCVILLTLSSVLLALTSRNDKPTNISRAKYFIGFFCTIGAGLLFALYLPVMEKIYKKVYCYQMVMEMQLLMQVVATTLAGIGMAFDGGFSEMMKESRELFDMGPTWYWVTVFSNVITWQLCFMGTAGMVFLTSSLTGGICMTALLAINVLGGVLVYKDEFGGVKVVSTALCCWGFCSYVYGLYVKMQEEEKEKKEMEKSNNVREMNENHLVVKDSFDNSIL